MSVNKDVEHVLVLPEDDANRQLANGFWQAVDWSRQRRMQVLAEAGGWNEVLNLFKSQHVTQMDRCPKRFMVLLIDFDSREDRLKSVKATIPEHLAERVFVLGSWTDPQGLKRSDLGHYEKIGSDLAKDCRDDTDTIWRHQLLRHNTGELDRLRMHVRPILFPST